MSENSYEVEEVKSINYNKFGQRFLLKVQWKEVDENGEQTKDDQPLENFLSCPKLVLDYERNEYEKLKRQKVKGPGGKQQRIRRLPGCYTKRHCREEYRPTGCEVVVKIVASRVFVIKGCPREYLLVKFNHDPVLRYVQLRLAEYYFPFQVLVFWKRNGMDGPVI